MSDLCPNCNETMINAYHCKLCDKLYCENCFKYSFLINETCPQKCELLKKKNAQVLSKHFSEIFNCVWCDNQIKGNNIEHMLDCPNVPVSEKITLLTDKIKELKSKTNQLKAKRFILPEINDNAWDKKGMNYEGCVKFSNHPHYLHKIKLLTQGFCEYCFNFFEGERFYCSLCNFSCCTSCKEAENTRKSIDYLRKHKGMLNQPKIIENNKECKIQ